MIKVSVSYSTSCSSRTASNGKSHDGLHAFWGEQSVCMSYLQRLVSNENYWTRFTTLEMRWMMTPLSPPHENYSIQVFGEGRRGEWRDGLRNIPLSEGGVRQMFGAESLTLSQFSFSRIQFLGLISILEMTFHVDNTPTRQVLYGNFDWTLFLMICHCYCHLSLILSCYVIYFNDFLNIFFVDRN